MGNCLDRTLSDEEEDDEQHEDSATRRRSHRSERGSRSDHRHHHHHSSQGRNHRNRHASSRYSRLSDSSSSLSSVNSSEQHEATINRGYATSSSMNLANANSNGTNQFVVGLASSLENGSGHGGLASSFGSTPNQSYYLSPNVHKTAEQLTEEEQIKLLKRMTLVQQLPTGRYDGSSKKNKECVICMIDFEIDDTIKYLPCMHTFHQTCIDNWLVRSLVCPSCIEPVDALIMEHMIMNSE